MIMARNICQFGSHRIVLFSSSDVQCSILLDVVLRNVVTSTIATILVNPTENPVSLDGFLRMVYILFVACFKSHRRAFIRDIGAHLQPTYESNDNESNPVGRVVLRNRLTSVRFWSIAS